MSDVALSAFSKELVERLGEELETIDIIHHQIVISIRSHSLIKVMAILRDHSEYQFKQLTDICGADFPARPKRFEVIYHLLSMRNNIRLRIKIYCAEEDTIPSLVPIFPNANWYEREVWDLYGITFEDHPDLRRIMTDYNFEGHPLRKDFPLTGYVEVRYDELLKRVVYEPVKLNQEYRVFDFLSPWEGMLGNYEGAPDPSLLKVSTTRLSGTEQAGKSHNPIDDKNTRGGK